MSKYIDGKEKNGMLYDFDKVRKEYKKLKCPKDVYNPLVIPFDKCKWNLILSERARGKTTNLLLLGMVFNRIYGTEIAYVRSHEEMITPKNSRDLFNTIIECGYVEKLTDGIYNTVVYKSRRWYYGRIGDDGKIETQEETPFCMMLSVDKADVYKSALSLPKTDFILFDEFIERSYQPQQFIDFISLVSTVLRFRRSGVLFLSANTIDKNSRWFSELEIREYIEDMGQGDSKIITTKKGTNIYVELLGHKNHEQRTTQNIMNKLFYGFENEKLSGVTGSDTWAVATYPHTPRDFKILDKHHYLEYNNKLVNLEICQDKKSEQYFINCHYATQLYDDSIIYTLDFILDNRYRFKFGRTKTDAFLWGQYDLNKFTFADNSVGALVEKYHEEAIRRLRRNYI